jgi:hypothetical protein
MDMDEDDLDITSQPPQSPDTSNPFLRPAMLNDAHTPNFQAWSYERVKLPDKWLSRRIWPQQQWLWRSFASSAYIT